jgi:hypothetical protein
VQIKRVIESINALPNRWVTLEQIRTMPSQLELRFEVHREGRPSKKIGAWTVLCEGVLDASIPDFDGGGLALYSTAHPASRQFTARQADLSWLPVTDEATTLGTLYYAHKEAVDDWIPFDRYLPANIVRGKRCSCRGPEFLMRSYAKALRKNREDARLTVRGDAKSRHDRPKVLHFGESFVVAARLSAERTA